MAAWDAIRRSLPALALGLVFPAVGLAGLASGAARSAAGLVLASALYLLLAAVLWRSVGGQAIRLLRAR